MFKVNAQKLKSHVKEAHIHASSPDSARYFIRKEGSEYHIADKPITFNDTDDIYFKIFDVLFEKRNAATGFCSYETMDRELQNRGEKLIEDRKKMIERINNGLKNLYRYSNLPEKAPDNQKIIQNKPGKGLILHNPPAN